ncbi:MAG: RNA polymerase sigma-70 factor [Marinifilum sp.]|jgi:RNA polymerase sigma-70 factor (ECF subfamily)|nr:RNA polymerase sigma-70 factor [Marinifilum sp.]
MRNKEQEIIHKLKNNDTSGLRELFSLYYKPLCILAMRYLDDFCRSEDLVQEVFISFWEKKRIDNLTSSLKSYLFAAVKNASLNEIRKHSKYSFQEFGDELDFYDDSILEKEELEEKRKRVMKELNLLPSQARKVFDSIVFRDMKYKEVAEEMNVSINTIKTHYSRALKQLRNSLELIIAIFYF